MSAVRQWMNMSGMLRPLEFADYVISFAPRAVATHGFAAVPVLEIAPA
jgi:hypothetical protein